MSDIWGGHPLAIIGKPPVELSVGERKVLEVNSLVKGRLKLSVTLTEVSRVKKRKSNARPSWDYKGVLDDGTRVSGRVDSYIYHASCGIMLRDCG
jgi:hypothetical protein